MLFPKPTKKKKRRRHRESLLQNKTRRVESAISAQERGTIVGNRCWRSTTSSEVPTDTYQKSTD